MHIMKTKASLSGKPSNVNLRQFVGIARWVLRLNWQLALG